jgi:CxxC-x17-CxxC domain-containing protein
MYDAVCADCGNACKVPFNPTGEKPVYCSDCFDKHRDSDSGRGGNSGPSYGENRRFDRNRGESGNGSTGMDPQMKELLVGLNAKMDEVVKLLTLMSGKKTLRVDSKDKTITTQLEIKDED